MSEKVNKTPVEENEEKTAKKPATKTKEAKPVKEKKENVFKRGGRKVKNWMSDHPFWSSAISAGIGAGAATGTAFGVKKVMENRRNRNAYIPQQENQNDLDPNG